MKKRTKTILIIVLAVFLFVTLGGYLGYKIFGSKMMALVFMSRPGNAAEYSIEKVEADPDSTLTGKNIIFLGSSVTEGYGSGGVSFVDYLAARDGIKVVKEAVGGTTLVTENEQSYIPRMEKIDKSFPADAFVCQLSTNDASRKLPLGTISQSTALSDFDTSTVAGAIEYIICYAKGTWDCPVVFYVNPPYESEEYAAMVDLLLAAQEKWDITVIDFWNDPSINQITQEQKSLYMIDDVHPSKAGYLLWWTPVFEDALTGIFEN